MDLLYSDLTINEVCKKLGTDPKNGLSFKEVKKRYKKYGENKIVEEKRRQVFLMFFSQLKDWFAIILILAALISFFAGARLDAIVISFIVFLNAAIGFFQEYKAERAIRALKKILPSYTKVIRDGKERKILINKLVPGDLIILEEGDSVPADARVIEEYELSTNNATLTGESVLRQKSAKPFLGHRGNITEISNLIFMGTDICSGRGKAIVLKTGRETEFGKIANLTQSITVEYSPLQLELARLAKTVMKIVIIIGILGVLIGKLNDKPLIEMFLFALGIMVACVPEGLPATVSVALAAGVQRMAKRNALLKRLSAVETLGCTTVICTDKTGTLTKGEITVKELWIPGNKKIKVSGSGYEPKGDFFVDGKKFPKNKINKIGGMGLFFRIIALCNNAKILKPFARQKKWSVIGDPTEGALLTLLEKAGLNQEKILEENPKIYELSFSSLRKRMTSVHRDINGDVKAYIKGAPENILDCCKFILINGMKEKITEEHKKEIFNKNDRFSEKTYRVLALAYRDLPEEKMHYTVKNTEEDLTFIGLCALIDPPREEVSEAIEATKKAGIKTIMITGDYGLTAKAIAKEINLVSENVEIIEGSTIDKLSNKQLKEELDKKEIIFVRVSPEHKMRIVKTLKEKGEIVAVTGDGANDAPALKAADIGIAMGISGTDVSKESADMILLDDSFATITAAIEEGRRVFDNIKKFNLYVFSSNIGELFSVMAGALLSIPIPITAIQILSVDLGTDVLPSLALGVEPAEKGIMKRPPRSRKESLLNKEVFLHLLEIGLIMAGGAVIGFIATLLRGGWQFGERISNSSPLYFKATTVTYATLVVVQFVNSFCCRSERRSLFTLEFFSNKYILGAIFVSFSLLFALTYLPITNRLWHTAPIDGVSWVFIMGSALFLFIFEEIRKYFLRKKTEN